MKKQSAKAKARARARAAKDHRAKPADPPANKAKEQSWIEEFVDGAANAAVDKVIDAAVKAIVD